MNPKFSQLLLSSLLIAIFSYSFGSSMCYDNQCPKHTDTQMKNLHEFKNEYLEIAYDENRHQTDWVAYKVDANNFGKNVHPVRDHNFYDVKNPDYPGILKVKDYDKSYSNLSYLYDKGHLAPYADFDSIEPDSTSIGKQINIMLNIAPQIKSFNTGVWKTLEMKERVLAEKFTPLGVEVYVISGTYDKINGPILPWWPTFPYGLNSQYKIPNQFWKVITLSNPQNNMTSTIAFDFSNETPASRSICDYMEPIDMLEADLGYDLMPGLASNDFKEIQYELGC